LKLFKKMPEHIHQEGIVHKNNNFGYEVVGSMNGIEADRREYE